MGLSLATIAERLGGRLEGDGTVEVACVTPLADAGPDALAWLADLKLRPELDNTRAAGVLVKTGWDLPADRNLIRVDDPDLAMCAVLEMLVPPPEPIPVGVADSAIVTSDARVDGARIGERVYVGPRAKIGPNTQLHPGVYVGTDVEIGRDCVLWPNVVVRERCKIGDRVVISPNATIGADGFGYLPREGRHVKIPQVGSVLIEDDVEIGANAAIDRARSGVTRIARGTKIDNLVQIGHNAQIGEHCIIVAQCGISGSTTLGHHTVLGGQVGIIDHLRIGSCVQVGAQSGVLRDIEDGAVWFGYPADDMQASMRRIAALRRLPEMMRQFRAMQKRVAQLESSKDD
ncbi:MAG: UDP-3-O-(3-hydroxymyristoyl)glucosamine N-acyltransferase [Phycisphaerae bacterium]|nr:UDP-3-O-(3-hydroxymyristoyl)glucosamine N-acyltransferase [Phycisphaerae bacterium]